MDINQNLAKCIEHTNDFGATVVHNICNGTTQVVPWGSADWAGILFLCVGGILTLSMFGAMAVSIWGDR